MGVERSLGSFYIWVYCAPLQARPRARIFDEGHISLALLNFKLVPHLAAKIISTLFSSRSQVSVQERLTVSTRIL